jgi:isopenicillin-N epimerase
MPLNDGVFLRFSINAYNTVADLDTLYAALWDIIQTTDLIDM